MPALAQVVRERRQRGLHADLDGFPRAQGDVGEEFGRGAGAQVEEGAVGVGEEAVAVEVFEVFVEAVFAGALEGVADGCWRPAEEDAVEAFFGVYRLPALDVGGVDVWAYLASAFDDVQRCYGGVGWSCGCC